MEVTLTKDLFKSDKLPLDKKLNFIFGKNGTGKSTLTNLINEQFKETHDIRIFNGFDNIVGEDKKLNAVILGEENNDINNQILEKEKYKKENNEKLSKENSKLEKLKENFEKSNSNLNSEKDILKDKLTAIASNIKNNKLNIVSANYNRTYLKQDIKSKNFKELDEETIEKYEKIINSEARNANKINIEKIDLQDLLNKTNIILQKK